MALDRPRPPAPTTVLRYVERNPLRAGLAGRAKDWLWSSAAAAFGNGPVLDAGPVARPPNWPDLVDEPQTEAEVAALRRCVRRGRPYGGGSWAAATAARLDLAASLRPLGRPRKSPGDGQPSLFDGVDGG